MASWTTVIALIDEHRALGANAHLEVIETLNDQIHYLEQAVLAHANLQPRFRVLKSIGGVGQTLALTIMYEAGEIDRFASVGNYASYCRLVRSQRRSNNKKKGEGNRKNGNPYLSWAYSEAAAFALRFQPRRRRSRRCHKPGEAHEVLAFKDPDALMERTRLAASRRRNSNNSIIFINLGCASCTSELVPEAMPWPLPSAAQR